MEECNVELRWHDLFSWVQVEELCGHAQRGLPASVRGLAWAALLGVDAGRAAAAMESGAAGQCDEGELRQMGRDVPRCHGYDPILAGPAGRARLGRVLAAWAGRNPDLAYWQVHTRTHSKQCIHCKNMGRHPYPAPTAGTRIQCGPRLLAGLQSRA